MRLLPALLAAAVAFPAASQELPPPPRDRWRPAARAASPAEPAWTIAIGDAPVAPAGSQAAPLRPDEGISSWRYALSTGVAGKFGGMRISSARENPAVLLYFGAQADGAWTHGRGQAVRLRLRMFTGGEKGIYVPSDGDAEAAFMIGRPELRFVIGRVELARHPALGIQTLAQFATLPCFEGTISLAGDTMRLTYYVSPIEGAWVYYRGPAHIPHSAAWSTESDRPSAATAARLRHTVLLPPGVLLSLQGDLMKMWRQADLLLSGEGSAGFQILDRSAMVSLVVRATSYTRRGLAPETSERDAELLVLGVASLAF
jgi:hypothetical protein